MATLKAYDPSGTTYTQLTVDVPATGPQRIVFDYFDGTALRHIFAARIPALFRIQFRKYDLDENRMFWGFVEYAPSARPTVFGDESRITIEYTNVDGRLDVKDPRGPEVPPTVPNLPAPVPIAPIDRVTVTLTPEPPSDPSAGWIRFDIDHGYPRYLDDQPLRFAWEETLIFPAFNFAAANPQRLRTIAGTTLKFSAVWTEVAQAHAAAAGIAIHCEDERGHDTSCAYDDRTFVLTHALRNSIHLSGRAFVHKDRYVLSDGDAFGFGGNLVHYRLRAFYEKAPCPGAAVTWHDAAEVYRSWMLRRYANDPFYREFLPRRSKAPVDDMAPHTVIMNYGLDGSVPAAHPLSAMLELHTPVDTQNANRPPSFASVVRTLRGKFGASIGDKNVEAQLWGIEKAGFYQFLCGYPYLSDVLGRGTITEGIDQLLTAHAVTTITTDPMNVLFNRGRFGGNIRWKGGVWNDARLSAAANWEAFIQGPFHPKVANRDETCAVTQGPIGGKRFDRVWYVSDLPEAGDRTARRFERAQKRDPWGPSELLPAIGSGIFRGTQKQICPTDDIAELYIGEWVQPRIVRHHAWIVEFMKHPPHACFCYRRDHAHIASQGAYDNVIGAGSWYVGRIKSLLARLQQVRPSPDVLFRVAHEFEPAQPLMPYIDQYYSGSEVHAFVYSHMATPMMSPGRDGGGVHPGYREKIREKVPFELPAFMLGTDRDVENPAILPQTPGMTEAEVAALYAARDASFTEWRNASVAYASKHIEVANWGIAPRGYPTAPQSAGALVPWSEQNPLAVTNPRTYTYSRCVQQTFSLRANLFLNGIAAVRGVRIMIPASWVEEPTGYDAPVLDHAVLAARLQMEHAAFFRYGRMLGQTTLSVNGAAPKTFYAWLSGLGRDFSDVKPLVEHIGADDAQLGKAWRSKPLRDFISRGWDKQTADVNVVRAQQIEHRVWEEGTPGGRILYAFANVSNSAAHVRFLYGHGLEGTTRDKPRTRKIFTIGGAMSTGQAWLGLWEEQLHMAPRSFAAVVVE